MNLLSVIMTSYNENPVLLQRSLDSILEQTFKSFNLIIVIEYEDSNEKIFENYSSFDKRIILIKNSKNIGFTASLNQGIIGVKTKYIARIDSNDICNLKRFEKQVNFMENNNVDVLGSWIEYDNSFLVRKYPELHVDIVDSFLFTSAIAHPASMIRKSALDKFGLYDENFNRSEDLELWLRLLRNGCIFHNLQEKLVVYNVGNCIALQCRSKQHWYFNYKARALHNKFIYPFIRARFSAFISFLLFIIPEKIQHYIEKLIANKIKKIGV